MHVLLNILNLEKGGAQRVMSNLANGFIQSGHDVTLISCFHDGPAYPLDSHIELICLDEPGPVHVNRLWRFLLRRKALARKLTDLRYDIVISFLPESNFLLLSLRKLIKAPVIVSLRNDPKHEYRTLLRQLLMRWFYAKADGFVYQTQEAQDYFKSSSIHQKPSVILLNPIENHFYRKSLDQKKSFRIVSVGRLVTQKNQRLLIDAFQKVHQKYPEYHLEIYGEGPLKRMLEERIQLLDLDKYVSLKGIEDHLEIVLSEACMFVLSSDFEGLPNALIEAMAMGVCVVSTDCEGGGPRNLIRDRYNGRLVRTGDQDDLVRTMSELLEHPELRDIYGRNAYLDSQKMKLEAIIPQWLDFMNELISVK